MLMRMLSSLCATMGQGKKICSLLESLGITSILQSSHRGNFANEPPYTTGTKPCESCPYDYKYCVKNLCCKYHLLSNCTIIYH